MPFHKIEAEKLAAAVMRQIEDLILQGVLRPGERLPGERELSERLGVSRPSLREAIAQLQQQGLLIARPGAGIFVAEVLGSAFSPALVRIFARHETATADYLAFRGDLEGLAAERAARFGSDTDLKVIDRLLARMEAAHPKRNPAEEAELDAQFHMAIIEAGHNVVMLHMMRAMFDLLQDGVFYDRQAIFRDRALRDALLDQHRAINAALQIRDGAAARRAVMTHIGFVETFLAERRKAERNETVARMRLRHETEKP